MHVLAENEFTVSREWLRMSTPVLVLEKQLRPEAVVELSAHPSHVVRAFEENDRDVDAWLRLHNSVSPQSTHGRYWDRSDFRREFKQLLNPTSEPNSKMMLWLTETQQKVIGSTCVYLSSHRPDAACLNWLAVDADYRRQGIARRLLQTAEQFCVESGVHRIRATTLTTWSAAVRFYQSQGFCSQASIDD